MTSQPNPFCLAELERSLGGSGEHDTAAIGALLRRWRHLRQKVFPVPSADFPSLHGAQASAMKGVRERCMLHLKRVEEQLEQCRSSLNVHATQRARAEGDENGSHCVDLDSLKSFFLNRSTVATLEEDRDNFQSLAEALDLAIATLEVSGEEYTKYMDCVSSDKCKKLIDYQRELTLPFIWQSLGSLCSLKSVPIAVVSTSDESRREFLYSVTGCPVVSSLCSNPTFSYFRVTHASEAPQPSADHCTLVLPDQFLGTLGQLAGEVQMRLQALVRLQTGGAPALLQDLSKAFQSHKKHRNSNLSASIYDTLKQMLEGAVPYQFQPRYGGLSAVLAAEHSISELLFMADVLNASHISAHEAEEFKPISSPWLGTVSIEDLPELRVPMAAFADQPIGGALSPTYVVCNAPQNVVQLGAHEYMIRMVLEQSEQIVAIADTQIVRRGSAPWILNLALVEGLRAASLSTGEDGSTAAEQTNGSPSEPATPYAHHKVQLLMNVSADEWAVVSDSRTILREARGYFPRLPLDDMYVTCTRLAALSREAKSWQQSNSTQGVPLPTAAALHELPWLAEFALKAFGIEGVDALLHCSAEEFRRKANVLEHFGQVQRVSHQLLYGAFLHSIPSAVLSATSALRSRVNSIHVLVDDCDSALNGRANLFPPQVVAALQQRIVASRQEHGELLDRIFSILYNKVVDEIDSTMSSAIAQMLSGDVCCRSQADGLRLARQTLDEIEGQGRSYLTVLFESIQENILAQGTRFVRSLQASGVSLRSYTDSVCASPVEGQPSESCSAAARAEDPMSKDIVVGIAQLCSATNVSVSSCDNTGRELLYDFQFQFPSGQTISEILALHSQHSQESVAKNEARTALLANWSTDALCTVDANGRVSYNAIVDLAQRHCRDGMRALLRMYRDACFADFWPGVQQRIHESELRYAICAGVVEFAAESSVEALDNVRKRLFRRRMAERKTYNDLGELEQTCHRIRRLSAAS